MSFANQFSALLEKYLRKVLKYKYRNVVYGWIVAPLIWVADIVLRGTYISTTDFYAEVVPYSYLLFFGFVVADYFSSILNSMFYTMLNEPRSVVMYNKAAWILANIVYCFIDMGLYVLVAWIPLHILYGFPTKFLIFSLLATLTLAPFTVATALILSYFIFKLRDDALPVLWSISFISWSIFPIGYALTIFPEPLRTRLEILFPPFGLIEEMRKLAIIRKFSAEVFTLSFTMSLLYLILGIFVFLKGYNDARRKGTVLLK